jgi:hypothetical protein
MIRVIRNFYRMSADNSNKDKVIIEIPSNSPLNKVIRPIGSTIKVKW